MRNNVAHKKIEICKQQEYLKFYDILQEYKERICPDNCSIQSNDCEISNDCRISLDRWKNTLKLANEYSKLFDEVLSELEKEYNQ